MRLLLLCLVAGFLLFQAAAEGAVVARVVDGDTLALADGERVRIENIDAPEMGDGCRGAEARGFLRALVEGKEVRLEGGHRDRDRYGRLLRRVALPGGDDVGEALIRAKLARKWAERKER